MESKKKAFSLYDIVMIGLMAAVVFVVTMFLSIRIPTPTGTTMIKPRKRIRAVVRPAARTGSRRSCCRYRLDDLRPDDAGVRTGGVDHLPAFLPDGMAVRRDRLRRCRCRKEVARNLVACLAGAVFSSLLYMLKGIIELMIGGSALVPAFVANIPKLMTSPPNIVIAVVVAMALLPALQKAMNSTSFGRHMAEK